MIDCGDGLRAVSFFATSWNMLIIDVIAFRARAGSPRLMSQLA